MTLPKCTRYVAPGTATQQAHVGSGALTASTCLVSELSRLEAPGSSPASRVPPGASVIGAHVPSFAQTPLSSLGLTQKKTPVLLWTYQTPHQLSPPSLALFSLVFPLLK